MVPFRKRQENRSLQSGFIRASDDTNDMPATKDGWRLQQVVYSRQLLGGGLVSGVAA
jgi:hypothetical protein